LSYFSSAGYIVNKTRSSLDANILNMLVCLRDWCRADTEVPIFSTYQ